MTPETHITLNYDQVSDIINSLHSIAEKSPLAIRIAGAEIALSLEKVAEALNHIADAIELKE